MINIFGLQLRLLVLAAILIHGAASASVAVTFNPLDQTLTLSGLQREVGNKLLENPSLITLQVAGVNAQHSMPLSVELAGREIVITPKFALLTGTTYVLNIGTSDSVLNLAVTVPSPSVVKPILTGFSPTQAIIPENILRI